MAKGLGCQSVEIVDPEDWGVLKKHGLICAIAPNGMPGAPFMKGFNNPKYHDEVIARTKKKIDACADAGFPSVIAFTGFKWRDAEDPTSGEISREEGADNCVAGLKKIIPYAESKGVTICLEHLNTRDNTHPMKGHPGYQGDDVDYVADILRRVGSPRMKLLFDIYHVQIMNGDVIRRIEQLKDMIGHVHTAGVPGRGELDDDQEVQYPPIMRKLLEIGYTGYVGQEFIPTRNPLRRFAAGRFAVRRVSAQVEAIDTWAKGARNMRTGWLMLVGLLAVGCTKTVPDAQDHGGVSIWVAASARGVIDELDDEFENSTASTSRLCRAAPTGWPSRLSKGSGPTCSSRPTRKWPTTWPRRDSWPSARTCSQTTWW